MNGKIGGPRVRGLNFQIARQWRLGD